MTRRTTVEVANTGFLHFDNFQAGDSTGTAGSLPEVSYAAVTAGLGQEDLDSCMREGISSFREVTSFRSYLGFYLTVVILRKLPHFREFTSFWSLGELPHPGHFWKFTFSWSFGEFASF